MAGMKTNTLKRDYYITVSLNGKTEATFAAHTDSVVNALKMAHAQACGWTMTPYVDPDKEHEAQN